MFSITGYKWIITCDTQPYNIHVWGTIKAGLGLFYESPAGCLFVQWNNVRSSCSFTSAAVDWTHKHFSVRQQANKSPTWRHYAAKVPNSGVTTPQNKMNIFFVINKFYLIYLVFTTKVQVSDGSSSGDHNVCADCHYKTPHSWDILELTG